MTKEQVLALNLTPTEKARVEGFYQSFERFNWTVEKDKFAACTTLEQVKAVCSDLQAAYEKRKEQEAKLYAKVNAKKEKVRKIIKLVEDAEKYGFTVDNIIETVTNLYKERHNAELQAKIAELQAKLL